MDYAQDYENSLHFSPRFQKYAEELAHNLVKRYDLYNKDIVEIGCGDGDFLELLCRVGNNHGFGFDPSRVPDLDKTGDKKSITFIRDYYSEKYSQYKADLVCCRHVLEHIQQPRQFLDNIRSALKDNTGTIVFFEVPNVLYTIKDLGIWDLIYEHCSYFSPTSLRTVFTKSGFEVIHDSEEFQGQFLGIEAKPVEKGSPDKENNKAELKEISDYVKAFAANYIRSLNYWQSQIDAFNKTSQKTVVWGAGSKGVTFLNILKNAEEVKYLVDINPRKQGKFVPGSGQKVISPEDLKKYPPDIAIVMNPVYLKEIEQVINQMNLRTKLISISKH
jgi:SAM-dependent methyltransferase